MAKKSITSSMAVAIVILKKAGVTKGFNKFITKSSNGYVVMVPDRKAAPKKAAKKSAKKATKTTKKKAAPKEKKITVASRIREMIKAGKTNEQVWKVVKVEFKLPDTKKHYPGWYRSQMNRDK